MVNTPLELESLISGCWHWPSPVQNQPSKSTVQTSLGRLAIVNPGCGTAGPRRARRTRGRTRPRRRNQRWMVRANKSSTTDDKIKSAGQVGLWTKADSVTLFDNFSYGAH